MQVPTLQVSTQPTPFPAPVQFAPTQRTRESPDDDAWEAAFAEEDDASIENWSTVGVYPDDRPTTPETPPIAAKQPRKRTDSHVKRRDKDHHPGIIPLDEDIRRLFQECKIGVGNANLLSETLVTATPEDLRNPAISEFYKDCINSQELIFAQIPWASAGAERSRAAAELNGSLPDISTSVSTREEELFAELLAANEHLLEAIDLYKDLERVALERDAEERSRREARMDLARSRRIYWALIT
ncbi:hypothetical protein FB45DRAFT_159649 [Roridomyces roridus]|uniref:Uncharacterized protein n=1 Tax=Roridomyces roridus TaxID=1738132 RepID=A0AAD7FHP9_9AGAR|nr:hypothetical protein FB45DRAFT_159649 [Roridomyces roridus]